MPQRYPDTSSSRAEIDHITSKLEGLVVAIVGVGGTGSYILDFVAKVPVAEVHLFDDDLFEQHNAFRSPGAAPLEIVENPPLKVDYFSALYSAMNCSIVSHGKVDETNIGQLKDMDFVFVAVDDGPTKGLLASKLEEFGVPFVDAGMGLREDGDAISGLLRVVLSIDGNRPAAAKLIPTTEVGPEGIYQANIQVAELNALGAVLAVIRWKKLWGFYADSGPSFEAVFNIESGDLFYSVIQDETA